ncbi:MAG: benzoylformate decarboxylase [Massilia sp.]
MSSSPTGQTVYEATYELLRKLKLTTIFGNPGSTEQPFLKNFPSDFTYVLGLQEASAVAMADGFAQASGRPVLLNLHSSVGLGNAMGNIVTAFQNKTPLIITAGQQTRDMLLGEPLLTNRDETMLPRPWVKWSFQPARAQDVPAALMRAYAIASQPPAGPVFVSIPMDDWDQPALGDALLRMTSTRYAPDPDQLAVFADRIRHARKPALVLGQEVARSGGWDAAIRLAEQLQLPVFEAPLSERAPFPQTHPQYHGPLPMAIGPLSQRLKGHDLLIVVGAPVFRYYPYVPGSYLPEGAALLHITNDPADAASAVVGDSLLSDARLALEGLAALLPHKHERSAPFAIPLPELPAQENSPVTAREVFAALAAIRPDDAILLQETPSSYAELLRWWPIQAPDAYYTYASGGLGWNTPAAVGVALAERHAGGKRPVVAVIGDGSLQYSIQSLYSAVQHKLKIVYIVPCNAEYAILKRFAELEHTPNVPALDLPGLDPAASARGFGMRAVTPGTVAEIKAAFAEALAHDGPTMIAIPVKQELLPLVG